MRIHLQLPFIAILLAFAAHADPAPAYDFLPLSLDPGSGEFPEGIAVDRRGNLYYSLAPRGEVWRATREGDLELLAALDSNLPPNADGALGLAAGREGVYAALMACNASVCNESHGVWLIRNARKRVHLSGTEQIAMPNALALGRHGELYVSDTLTGAIWVLRRRGHHGHEPCGKAHRGRFTSPEIWIQDDALMGTGALGFGRPLGANGLAYSRGDKARHDEILVANTEQGALLAIPVERRGRAGDIEVVAQDPALFTVDGIAVDRYGDALALTVGTVGPGGLTPVSRLLHIHRDSGEIQLVLGGAPLHFSTSLAFGRRPGTEQSLFVTNWALLAPLFGLAAEPGIVRIDLGHTWFVAPE